MRGFRKTLLLSGAAMAISMTAAIFFSACSLFPKYSNPKRFEIGGETYVSGFYENLWPDGITFGQDEPPAFETQYHLWWEAEGGPFVLYCAQNKEALYWNPSVYCKEDEAEAVRAYYSDPANYDYYIGLYGDSNRDSRIRLENVDTELLERAVARNMEIEANSGQGLLTGQSDVSAISVQIPEKERLDVQPVLYRVSKDGFFTTVQNEWLVTEGRVYILGAYNGDTDNYTAYVLDGEVSDYIMALFREYRLL